MSDTIFENPERHYEPGKSYVMAELLEINPDDLTPVIVEIVKLRGKEAGALYVFLGPDTSHNCAPLLLAHAKGEHAEIVRLWHTKMCQELEASLGNPDRW
jgi:hypothetical protein